MPCLEFFLSKLQGLGRQKSQPVKKHTRQKSQPVKKHTRQKSQPVKKHTCQKSQPVKNHKKKFKNLNFEKFENL